MEDFTDREPIHIRKHEIQQDDVGQGGPGHVQSLDTIRGGEDFTAVALEVELKQLDKFLIVIYNQYFRSHAVQAGVARWRFRGKQVKNGSRRIHRRWVELTGEISISCMSRRRSTTELTDAARQSKAHTRWPERFR